MEVVTDKQINMPKNARIREIVVPQSYTTKSGCRYKSRALQYALEDDVNLLNDEDWIVHLDEETILTESSVRGILNFLFEGKHQIGQGLITYANEEVVNWVTTLADSFRVGADLGMLRFCLRKFNSALFLFKGLTLFILLYITVGPLLSELKVVFKEGNLHSLILEVLEMRLKVPFILEILIKLDSD